MKDSTKPRLPSTEELNKLVKCLDDTLHSLKIATRNKNLSEQFVALAGICFLATAWGSLASVHLSKIIELLANVDDGALALQITEEQLEQWGYKDPKNMEVGE